MIRFFCEHCSHKIGVQEKHAGKKCKCQRCDSIVVVPRGSTIVDFNCENCGRKITARQAHAGKKGKCPKCGHMFVVPMPAENPNLDKGGRPVNLVCLVCGQAIHVLDTLRGELIECPHCGSEVKVLTEHVSAEKSNTPVQEHAEDTVDGLSLEERQLLGGEMRAYETEQTGERPLPWLVDIFLYPTNTTGIIHIFVFLIVPILIGLLDRFIFSYAHHYGSFAIAILYIFLIGYCFYYFSECVRDSAAGGIRTPETLGSTLGKDQMLEQYLTLFACYAFFFGPATFYRSYIYFSETEVNNVIFWSLLAYGVFFFPMGILAVIMFDSINGLNPILLVCSIASTFFQYCGLAVLFSGFCFLRVQMLFWSLKYRWGILVRILPDLVLLWLLFMVAHLIGRFYWRYKEKLNWEV